MYRKEVNERSPLRLLDKSIHGGLGRGNLGIVLARAGVGKTAFLVQLGLDDLLRDRKVLHVSLDNSIDRVRTWYDELFADLCRYTDLDDPTAARVLVERNRMIQVYGEGEFSAEKLRNVTMALKDHADFTPDAILVDGLDFGTADTAVVEGIKALARELDAELWMSVLIHRGKAAAGALPAPAGRFDTLVDVAVLMAPRGEHVDLRLLRDHENKDLKATTLELEPVSLRLTEQSAAKFQSAEALRASACTLYSGAATGTESLFGEQSEKYGITEVNYTFPSHEPARKRGLVMLSDRELRQGDVSLAYVSRRMSRTYTSSQFFRRVLQTIWHQVNSSQQIFVVGVIQDDDTVKGGTGWGAELARVWSKPLWVFDQEQKGWFQWDAMGGSWVKSETPTITSRRFCGTGTRFLSDEGRAAVEALFAQSFGA
ncbi:MAG: AAA family ATPase [Proteobacteria bacterium]|nr:AAA family ATPase [Pseudomonadota bacterium]